MAARPNILLFMPETLRADAVFGPKEQRAKTPNMDRLAGEGVAFTNCFAQMAFCSPSRCGMFTGRYPHTLGHRSLLSLLQPEQRNLFRDLKDAGYRNVAFGKNDLLSQEATPLCFDEWGLRYSADPPESYRPDPHAEGSKWAPTFYSGKRKGTDCRDSDWARVQSALDFLDEDHGDQPFCLYLPMNFVHPPYEVEEPWFSMHDIEAVPDPIPAELGGKRAYMRELHKAHGMGRLSADDLKEIKRVYFGMTSRIDHQLGLLLDKLEERGLADSTVVAVLSDHGDYAGDFGMVEKYVAGFEDCLLHVPLILRGPGVTPSDACGGLCEMTDLYPTLMEITGLEPQHGHFGKSLAPVLRGEPVALRDAVFAEGGHHPHEREQFHVAVGEDSPYRAMYERFRNNPAMAARAMMARTEKWKYTYSPDDRHELYDLVEDPAELVNLAGDPAHERVEWEMRERLLRWMWETSDVLPPQRDPRGWPKR